jgi:hypothetical protein
VIPLLRRNEVFRFVCKVSADLKEVLRGKAIIPRFYELIKFIIFYRFFEASQCLDVTFEDEVGCRRLLSYDISAELECKSDSDNFVSKTHTLLSEFLSFRVKFNTDGHHNLKKPISYYQDVLDWLIKMSPSFEDFTGWGAHWVLTQGVFSGVRYPTLKRLISQRGLAKIREQHGSLVDWYVHASKIEGPNFETFSELLKLEGPQMLDNSLERLQVLT